MSNKLDGGPGKPVSEGGAGYSCIAEIRMIETIRDGQPSTPFMRFGDKVRIEMKDKAGARKTLEDLVRQSKDAEYQREVLELIGPNGALTGSMFQFPDDRFVSNK